MHIKQRVPKVASTIDGLSNTLTRVLSSRGIHSSTQIDYSLNKLLPPQGLKHIDEAAELLAEAISAQASIVIVGDFDADGATSCALAMRCLKAFGLAEVSYLVPNRFDYGYGLSAEIVGVAALRQPDVIITVDNGISSIEGVYAAQQLGITVLVTDHHLPGEEIPSADVIVNPNLTDDKFASKNLAGVGVIFYVMLATRARLRQLGWFAQSGIIEPNMSQFLDLVALGTVADVVPLDQNNRILVQQGLQRIRGGKSCLGIEALLTVGNRNSSRITSSDLGFVVAPRLNAAGRLDDMSVGIECLLAESEDRAMVLAMQLDQLNRERREVELSMKNEAMAIVDTISIEQESPPELFVIYDESWHQGVVGLVASRIKDRTNRPVVALAPSDVEFEWKGSARSVEGVHIRDMLALVDTRYPDLISKYGGHAMAAGLTLHKKNLHEFQTALLSVSQEMTAGKDWHKIVWSDGELDNNEYTMDFAEQIRQLTPWGQGFTEPIFDAEFEVIEARLLAEKHAKLRLQPKHSAQVIDAIYFSYMDTHEALPQGTIRAAYRLDINEFRDRLSLQLMIEYIEF